MPDATPYGTDIVAWSEEQVAALRRLAAELRPNSREVDFENIIEEIGDVGRSEIRAAGNLIRQLLIHWLLGAFDPDAPAVAHWRGETRVFKAELRDTFAASMRQRLQTDVLWADALAAAGDKLAGFGRPVPEGLPQACPFSLAELLDPAFGWDEAVARLRGLAGRAGG
jgi:hypothetical protein